MKHSFRPSDFNITHVRTQDAREATKGAVAVTQSQPQLPTEHSYSSTGLSALAWLGKPFVRPLPLFSTHGALPLADLVPDLR